MRAILRASLPIYLLAFAAAAQAQYTWTGGSTPGSWSNATNWAASNSPVSATNTQLVFSFSGGGTASTNNLGSFTLNQFTHTSTGTAVKTITGGTLVFASNGATGPSIIQSSTAQFTINSAISIDGVNLVLSNTTGTLATLSGTISGTGLLDVRGGFWLLAGSSSSFSGGVNLSGASTQLVLNADSTGDPGAVTAGPAGTGKITLQGGILRTSNGSTNSPAHRTVNNDVDIDGDVQFGNNSPATSKLTLGGAVTLLGNTNRTVTLSGSNPVVLAGAVAGSGASSALTVVGTGTLEFSGTGANTYSGNTRVSSSLATLLLNKTGANAVAGNLNITANGGTVRLGQSDQIADTSTLDLSGGTFDLNGKSETIQTIVGTGTTITSSAAGSSTLTINGGESGDTGVVITDGSGTVSVVKNGSSALILRGDSTYSGGTTLNDGQLALVSTNALGTGTITLNGGILRTQDSTAQNFSNNLEIGGSIQLGIASTGATMTFNGATTILGSGETRSVNFLSGSGTNRTPVIFAGAIGDGGNGNGLSIGTSGTAAGAGNFTTVAFGAGSGDTAANTYTGLTTVGGEQTRLLLDKAAGTTAIAGDLTISAGRIDLARSEQIADTAVLTISGGLGGALVDLGGFTETVGSFAVSSTTTAERLANGTLIASGGTGTNTVDNFDGILTISANLQGGNQLFKTGNGILHLSGSNTYTGGTLIRQASTSTNGTAYGVVLKADEALGSGSLRLDPEAVGQARLALNGYNQTVSALSSSATGLSIIEANGDEGGSVSTLTINQATDTAYSGILRDNFNTTSATLALVKTGSGLLDLSGVTSGHNYSGGLTVNGGTVGFGSAVNALGTATITLGGGALRYTATGGTNSTLANTVALGTATTSTLEVTDSSVGLTITNVVSGSGALSKTGNGVLTLSGANTYTGATTVAGGTLRIDGNARLGNTTNTITLSNAGILEITAAGVLTNAITIGTGNGVLSNSSAGALVIAGAVSKDGTVLTSRSGSGTNVFTGVISGSSANSDFVVDGGTTVFSNVMTYNGPTIITNGGTLVLGVDDAMPSGSDLILGGGTFLVDVVNYNADSSLSMGTLTLTEDSTIDLGGFGTSGVRHLLFAASAGVAINWNTNAVLTITNWQGVANQTSAVTKLLFGTGGLDSTQLAQIRFADQNIDGGQLLGGDGELAPIPEAPVVWGAAALAAFIVWRERRRLTRYWRLPPHGPGEGEFQKISFDKKNACRYVLLTKQFGLVQRLSPPTDQTPIQRPPILPLS
jgi:autotransporter-associated beta strand protein